MKKNAGMWSLAGIVAAALVCGIILWFRRGNLSPALLAGCALIVLAGYLLGLCGRIRQTYRLDKENVSDMRAMLLSIQAVKRRLGDPALIEKAAKLEETLRFSDPVKAPKTRGIEARIRDNLNLLEAEAATGDPDVIRARLELIGRLIEDRGDLILASKQ